MRPRVPRVAVVCVATYLWGMDAGGAGRVDPPGADSGPGAKATVSARSGTPIRVGAPFVLEVRVEADRDVTVAFDGPLPETDALVCSLAPSPDVEAGGAIPPITAIACRSGSIEVPPIALLLRDSAGVAESLRTAPIALEVVSDAPREGNLPLRDNLAWWEAPSAGLAPWKVVIGVAGFLAGAIVLLRARRRAAGVPMAAEDPPDPWRVARLALEEALARCERGAVEEALDRGAEAARLLAGALSGREGLAMTAAEVGRELRVTGREALSCAVDGLVSGAERARYGGPRRRDSGPVQPLLKQALAAVLAAAQPDETNSSAGEDPA